MTSSDPGDMASALITPPLRHQRHRKGPADSHQRGLPRSGDRPWARTPPTASGPPHQPKKMTSITSVPPLWPTSETPSPRKPRHIHTERSPAHARHRTPWTRRVRTETSAATSARPPPPCTPATRPPPASGPTGSSCASCTAAPRPSPPPSPPSPARPALNPRTRHLDLTDVDRAVTYLDNNHQHMKYDKALASGWPIATGMIEGACRFVIEDRFGITGARWSPDGAEDHPQAPRRRRQRRPRRLHELLQGTLPQRAPPRPLRRGQHRPPQPRRMTETPRNDTPLRKTHPLVPTGMSRGGPEGNAAFPGTDGIRGRRVFGAADLTERLRALTGGDEHGTQVERVPQWTPVRMRCTGH